MELSSLYKARRCLHLFPHLGIKNPVACDVRPSFQQLPKDVDENGGGPGVRLRKRKQKKG